MGSELFEVESFEIYDQVLRILASVFLIYYGYYD